MGGLIKLALVGVVVFAAFAVFAVFAVFVVYSGARSASNSIHQAAQNSTVAPAQNPVIDSTPSPATIAADLPRHRAHVAPGKRSQIRVAMAFECADNETYQRLAARLAKAHPEAKLWLVTFDDEDNGLEQWNGQGGFDPNHSYASVPVDSGVPGPVTMSPYLADQ